MQRLYGNGILLLGIVLSLPSPAGGGDTVKVSSRDQLVKAVAEARPGTTILIAAGTYQGGLSFDDLQGQPGSPIILAAADEEHPPIFQGTRFGIHLTDAAFVELRHLELTGAQGNGLNIDDGGSYNTPAHDIVLRGLTIRDIGPQGNRDGVKLSGVDRFRVEACTIERWGEAGSGIDMVGCHDGTIVDCVFRHRDGIPANGVQTKGGSRHVVIQKCRFENAGGRGVNIGGSTGLEHFRPPLDGYEAQDITVEDCTFVGSSAPICFVGVDGAVVQYNTIYRPHRYVMQILQESQGDQFVPCRKGIFRHNLIAFRADEIRGIVNIGPGTAADTFQFAHNWWYCVDRPQRSDRLSLPVSETGGSYGLNPQFVGAEAGDLRLEATSPAQDVGVRRP